MYTRLYICIYKHNSSSSYQRATARDCAFVNIINDVSQVSLLINHYYNVLSIRWGSLLRTTHQLGVWLKCCSYCYPCIYCCLLTGSGCVTVTHMSYTVISYFLCYRTDINDWHLEWTFSSLLSICVERAPGECCCFVFCDVSPLFKCEN